VRQKVNRRRQIDGAGSSLNYFLLVAGRVRLELSGAASVEVRAQPSTWETWEGSLAARPFHKDGCVTQASIVENKLLSGALTEIRKRQQQREQDLVRSAKSKREKRIVRDRFADRLPPPGP
jgi:hypothetical protein